MPTNRLTDAACRRAQPAERPFKLFDGLGLALVVLPSGSKTWRLFIRQDGKQRPVTIGPYPTVSLADARKQAAEARERARLGVDASLRPKRAPASILTVRQACLDYWQGRKDTTDGYRANALRGLELHVWPTLGDVGVEALTRKQVLEALSALDARGAHVYVRKVRVWLALPLDRLVGLEILPANVARAIDPKHAFGRAPVEHHASVSQAEVPALMKRLSFERDLQSVLACKMLALTWVRTAELRMMQWSEIEGDLWRIPAGKMKRKREHLVPLSTQALTLLQQLRARCRGSDYVFPADHRIDRPMSENAVLYLLDRMGYGGKMTGHGFRSVGSTWAHEAGYPSEAIELQLSHAPQNKVASAYNRAHYLSLRQKMLQAFADWIMPKG